jgi:hypothetical protein
MKKHVMTIVLFVLVGAWSFTGLCQVQDKEKRVQQEGYSHGWHQGGRMGFGPGPGYWMDDRYTMPPDYSMPGPLQSLRPEDRKKWEKMWAKYLMESMETRKQIAVKRIELETLWAQPDFDRERVEKLSSELSDLHKEQMKACDRYVIKAREEFGKLGWACPLGIW